MDVTNFYVEVDDEIIVTDSVDWIVIKNGSRFNKKMLAKKIVKELMNGSLTKEQASELARSKWFTTNLK